LLRPQRRSRLWVPELQHSAGLWQQAEVVGVERLRQEAEPPAVVAELVPLRPLAAQRRHLPGILEVVLMAE